MWRREDVAWEELRAGAEVLRQGLAANEADRTQMAGTPTQAEVVAVLRRMLQRERRLMEGLRTLARWRD